MKILHVLDHSVPLHSGYTFRTLCDPPAAAGFWLGHSAGHLKQAGCTEALLRGCRWIRLLSDPAGDRVALGSSPIQSMGGGEGIGASAGRDHRKRTAGHSACPLTEPEWYCGDSRCEAAATPCRLRVPRLLGGRGGRPRDESGGRRTIPIVARAETWVFRSADAVTCICDGLRDEIIGRQIGQDRMTVIANGVDTNRFSYTAPRDLNWHGISGWSGRRSWGFLAHSTPMKGSIWQFVQCRESFRRYLRRGCCWLAEDPRNRFSRICRGLLAWSGRSSLSGGFRMMSLTILQPRRPAGLSRHPMRLTGTGNAIEAFGSNGPRKSGAGIRCWWASGADTPRDQGWLFPAGDVGAFCQAVRGHTGLTRDSGSGKRKPGGAMSSRNAVGSAA